HDNLAAALLILAGAAAGAYVSTRTYLSPDEGIHCWQANHATLAGTYQDSRWGHHPPLYILGLHCWQHLGHSETAVRRVGAVAAARGLAFKWLDLVAGRFAASSAWPCSPSRRG